MNRFDELFNNPVGNFRKVSMSPEQIADEKLREERHLNEVVNSEIEEWFAKIEEASTPEERKAIISYILNVAELEESLVIRKLVEDLNKGGPILIPEESRKDIMHMINTIRAQVGLPPKYPV